MVSPDISIVIPSFNQGQYIERTLLSILKQDYQGKVQIIVSDGGSTDNTVEVLKKYDQQIIWWSKKDSGYADAVNKGFAKATGEICAIQSSDDYYLRNAFLQIVEKFRQYPHSSLVCGREVLQNPDGFVFGGYPLPAIITPGSFLMDHPFPGIFQHTTFFKRSYFEKANGLRGQFDMCADADLFYRMLHFADGHFLDSYIAVYQKHSLQRTQTQTLIFENQILDMVLSCSNDPHYSSLFKLTDTDYSLLKDFINLFYLQYGNPEKALTRAEEVLNISSSDWRTRNLARQIVDSAAIARKEPISDFINKTSRSITHLFRKYISHKKPDLRTEEKISFAETIGRDWWQN